MEEVPVAENKGALGQQVAENILVPKLEPPPFQTIAHVMDGLASSKSKSFGGEVSAKLISGSFAQLSYDLEREKESNNSLRSKIELATEELHKWKGRALVLEERVNANGKIRLLGNISITFGSASIGVAIELYRNNFSTPSIVMGFIGTALIITSLFFGMGAKDDSK